jgi:polyhydroxyalkanoate synthesis regulator phasin
MATDFVQDLDEELTECKAALQDQAQAMLELLLQFEARLQSRLDAAQARIDALRSVTSRSRPNGNS